MDYLDPSSSRGGLNRMRRSVGAQLLEPTITTTADNIDNMAFNDRLPETRTSSNRSKKQKKNNNNNNKSRPIEDLDMSSRNNVFFWGALVGALRDNPNVMETVFADMDRRLGEFQRASKTTGTNNNNFADDSTETAGRPNPYSVNDERLPPTTNTDGMNDTPTTTEYIDLLEDIENEYGFCRRDPSTSPAAADDIISGTSSSTTANNNNNKKLQSLPKILDSLDISAMFVNDNYCIPFGALLSKCVHLLSDSYSNDYENFAVHMLKLSMDDLMRENGDQCFNAEARANESYDDVYRRRGKTLYKLASFRYYVEMMFLARRLSESNRDDLIMLYTMLSTPDALIYRSNSCDTNYMRHLDPVKGSNIRTIAALTRPFYVSMRPDSVFGNMGKSLKKLERSLFNASQNFKRKLGSDMRGSTFKSVNRDDVISHEVAALLKDATLLSRVRSIDSMEMANFDLLRVERNRENSLLKRMLMNTMIVSMMAEEFRVYMLSESNTPRAPPGATGKRTKTANDVNNDNDDYAGKGGAAALRNIILPVFYRFQPKNAVDSRRNVR